jgi:hypothetical protein
MPVHTPMLARFIANIGDFARGLKISTLAEAVTMTVRMSGLYEGDGSVVYTVCVSSVLCFLPSVMTAPSYP